MIKALIPLSLLIVAYLNTTYQNEVIVSAKDDIEFEAKSNKITNIVAEQQSKYFDWRKDTHGIMLPRGDRKQIYLTKEDYINLQK
jgi:hypothetical protein